MQPAFPKTPGTYALLVELRRGREISGGRLGSRWFPAGYYVYVGSGLGPGGLSARLNRHLSGRRTCFWHIDYLLEYARVVDQLFDDTGRRLECTWVRTLLGIPGVEVLAPRFGSSDCECPAHLAFLGPAGIVRWQSLRIALTNGES